MRVIQYSLAQRELAFDWADHWFRLADLILEVIHPDEQTSLVPPPPATDELRYQILRQWFAEHETKFFPLWRDFSNCLRFSAFITTGYTEDVMRGQSHCEELFSTCYQPGDLYLLAKERGLQTETTVWQPDPERAWEFAERLLHIGNLVVWFFKWVDNQVGNRNQLPVCDCSN